MAPANEEAWEAMHETCENGNWEAMEEAAEEIHGEDFSDMPCHDGSYDGRNVLDNYQKRKGGEKDEDCELMRLGTLSGSQNR